MLFPKMLPAALLVFLTSSALCCLLGCSNNTVSARVERAEPMTDVAPDRPDGDIAAYLPAIEPFEGPPASGENVSEEREVALATGPSSDALSCGLHNPMPGGFAAGYAADTGLDLAGMKTPVFALASGNVDYAESGHSLWTGRGDTDLAVRIELDEPIVLADGRKVTHAWYAHLYELAFEQEEGVVKRRRVAAGEYLGLSGRANGMWHLHLGLLLDGDTTQRWGSFLLEDEVRSVLCGLKTKTRLPALSRS
ncbi:MAG: hypothetical protein HOW73_06035 [Polyangiaceae bacterium]|nr:hypothetical protein [Polyangiaceae bacterium]